MIKQRLEAARHLIEKPGTWTQGANARVEPWGRRCDPCNPYAVCWCAQGAVIKVCETPEEASTVMVALRRGSERLGFPGVVTLND